MVSRSNETVQKITEDRNVCMKITKTSKSVEITKKTEFLIFHFSSIDRSKTHVLKIYANGATGLGVNRCDNEC